MSKTRSKDPPGSTPQGLRGLGLYFWFLRDAVAKHGLRLVLPIGVGAAGAALELAAIGQAIYLAKQVESGGTIAILSWVFETRSPQFLQFATVAVGATMLVAAAMQFWAQKLMYRIRQEHEGFCAQRILSGIRAPEGWRILWPGSGRGLSRMLRLMNRDARNVSNAVRVAMLMVVPAVQGTIAAGALFLTNVSLTLFLFVPGAFYVWSLYRANVYNARTAAAQDDLQEDSIIEVRRVLAEAGTSSDSGEDLVAMESYRRAGVAYDARFMALEYASLSARAFMAVSVVAVMAILVSDMLDRTASWGALVVYLLALRYAFSSLRQGATLVTRFNRFYPRLLRYAQALMAVDAAEDAPQGGEPLSSESHRLFLRAPASAIYSEMGQLFDVLARDRGVPTPRSLKWTDGESTSTLAGLTPDDWEVRCTAAPQALGASPGSVLLIATDDADAPEGFTPIGVWDGERLRKPGEMEGLSAAGANQLESELSLGLDF